MKKTLRLSALMLATIMTPVVLVGCSSDGETLGGTTAESENRMDVVKSHSFNTDYPDTPLKDVINKFVENPVWNSKAGNVKDYVTVSGNMKNVGKTLYIEISIKDDPEDADMYLLDVEKFSFGAIQSVSIDDAWGYMIDIYDSYGKGNNDLTAMDKMLMDTVDTLYPLEKGFVWVDPPHVVIDEFGYPLIEGSLMNTSDTVQDASIRFVYYDKEGYQSGIAWGFISSVKPGNKGKFSAAIGDKEISGWEFESFSAT